MKKALLISHHNVFDSGFVSTILYDCNCIIHIVDQKYLKNIKKNDLLKFDIVFIFGGKASANSNSKSITYELKFLKKIIKLNLNVIGFCLGAQLIAKLYGSKITNFKNNNTEIGYKKILNPNKKYFSRNDKFFFQFHNQGIQNNPNIEILANGRFLNIDAFKVKNKNIFGFQFHPEVNSHTIKRWYSTNLSKNSPLKDNQKVSLINYRKYSKNNFIWLKKFINSLI